MTTFSYWEQQCLDSVDWVVIGAGLVGLQSARRLKETYPHQRVVVVDVHAMGGAASLRNAGFVCFGSAGEMLDEIHRTSESDALMLYDKRFQGIQRLMNRYGAERLGFEATGGMEVFAGDEAEDAERVLGSLGYLNELLKSIQGDGAFAACETSHLGMDVYAKGVMAAAEGGIQTHLLYRAVRMDAVAAGVEIYEGMRVMDWSEHVHGVHVRMENGQVIRSGRLLLCTNGFTKNLMPEVSVAPARGQVFVTEALGELPFKGIFHADKGYIYFRSLGDRVLIGGARNLDFQGEETMDMQVTSVFEDHLKRYVESVVLRGKKVKFEYGWSGIMGMDNNRNPIIGWHSDRVCMAVRMGGMGVALSSWVTEEVVRVVRGDEGI
jgi:glycine/D-amino acid oxidase-like deaminating enzyme